MQLVLIKLLDSVRTPSARSQRSALSLPNTCERALQAQSSRMCARRRHPVRRMTASGRHHQEAQHADDNGTAANKKQAARHTATAILLIVLAAGRLGP